MRGLAGLAAGLLLVHPAMAQQQAASAPEAMPAATIRLTPPPPDQRAPRASVKFAPYRYDDILWENDRTAHRIYGPSLQQHEPPSGSGIDAWGKQVVWPFMERQLATGFQHDYHGEGLDYYSVGSTRGAGGLGVWFDNKLWTSRNWNSYRILHDGPDRAEFEVSYAPWPVDVVRNVWETRRFSLPLGTNFTRITSTISSNRRGILRIGIGIAKHPTSAENGQYLAEKSTGRFSFWSPQDPEKGAMGVALMVDPAQIVQTTEDADNYLVVLNVTPGQPFVYYMGATWNKAGQFPDRAAWNSYVLEQHPDFRVLPR